MINRCLCAHRIRQSFGLTLLVLALSACTHPERADMPPQIRTLTQENLASCKAVGGTPKLLDSYLTHAGDLNDDGKPDYITDLAGLECAGAWSVFCGSAGCAVTVWLSGETDYVVGWSSYAQAWELRGKEFIASLHGQFCTPPRIGAESCEMAMRFDSTSGE